MNVRPFDKSATSARSVRAVVDTNVFVSGCLGGKHAREIVDGIRQQSFRLVISESLVDELQDVLMRPKFKKEAVFEAAVVEVLDVIRTESDVVAPTLVIKACRDPKDNQILEAAVAGRADVIVTGDGDLLELDPFAGIEIMTPARFLEILSGRRG